MDYIQSGIDTIVKANSYGQSNLSLNISWVKSLVSECRWYSVPPELFYLLWWLTMKPIRYKLIGTQPGGFRHRYPRLGHVKASVSILSIHSALCVAGFQFPRPVVVARWGNLCPSRRRPRRAYITELTKLRYFLTCCGHAQIPALYSTCDHLYTLLCVIPTKGHVFQHVYRAWRV